MSFGGGKFGSPVSALVWREKGVSGKSIRSSGTELLGEEAITGSDFRRPREERRGGNVGTSSPQGINWEQMASERPRASVPVPGTSGRGSALQS